MHALLPVKSFRQQKQIEFQLARSLILYHANTVQATECACLCLNKKRAQMKIYCELTNLLRADFLS